MPPFVISKVSKELKTVWGWASVVKEADGTIVVDHQSDVIEPAELQRAAHVFMRDSRVGGIMHEQTDGIAHVTESLVTTEETVAALFPNIQKGLIPVGWCVAVKVLDDAVWQRILNGELSEFSIHGTGERVPYEE